MAKRTTMLEATVVNLFFWKRRTEPNTQGFRTQLEILSRELRLQLGDIQDAGLSSELLRDLNTLESSYLGDLRKLLRQTKSDILR